DRRRAGEVPEPPVGCALRLRPLGLLEGRRGRAALGAREDVGRRGMAGAGPTDLPFTVVAATSPGRTIRRMKKKLGLVAVLIVLVAAGVFYLRLRPAAETPAL